MEQLAIAQTCMSLQRAAKSLNERVTAAYPGTAAAKDAAQLMDAIEYFACSGALCIDPEPKRLEFNAEEFVAFWIDQSLRRMGQKRVNADGTPVAAAAKDPMTAEPVAEPKPQRTQVQPRVLPYQPRPVKPLPRWDAIQKVLEDAVLPMRTGVIAKAVGIHESTVSADLKKMTRAGRISRLKHGWWKALPVVEQPKGGGL